MSEILSYIKISSASQYLENKKNIKSGPVFTFNHITKEDVIKDIKKDLDASKASQEDNMLTKIKIIKENSDKFSNFTFPTFQLQSFNDMIDICIFPTSLKLANITAAYKKVSKISKEDYRPVSILPNI